MIARRAALFSPFEKTSGEANVRLAIAAALRYLQSSVATEPPQSALSVTAEVCFAAN